MSVGDGKDLAHKVPASAGGKMTKGNVKVEDASTNRDWRKGKSSYKVGVDK